MDAERTEREEALRELLIINAGLGIRTPEEGYNSLKWALDDLHRGLDALVVEGIRLRGQLASEKQHEAEARHRYHDLGVERNPD